MSDVGSEPIFARDCKPAAMTQTVPMRIGILDESASGRDAAEVFIREHYAAVYGAQVHRLLPRLMVLRDEDDALLAALGFRRACGGRLFLEHYLDMPVEASLSLRLGRYCPRFSMVEVGNLVAGRAGGARWLIVALTAYLKAAGADWAVFTAVRELRNAFARLGVELVALAPADRGRLPAEEQTRWGRYYDTDPQVMAASVHQSYEALQHYLDLKRDRHRLRPLWQEALAAGGAA